MIESVALISTFATISDKMTPAKNPIKALVATTPPSAPNARTAAMHESMRPMQKQTIPNIRPTRPSLMITVKPRFLNNEKTFLPASK
mmetsp:Transcript_24727/g.58668  ORF Transcript_24727/g.58668 Transcript_24727/m.58668 type:complete len:87 (-) Transcript_24727:1581-1841(-)